MRVVIAGGHGKIALIHERLLADRGDTAVGLIRNPDHIADVEAAGARPVVVDLEAATAADIAAHLQDADAVEAAGVRRYVMISAIGADVEAPDDIGDPVFVAYLRAKGTADDAIREREAIDATIVRPGHLTNAAGTGRVELSDETGRGDIPRADVAAVLVAVLDSPATAVQTFELIGGDTPIADAVTTSARG